MNKMTKQQYDAIRTDEELVYNLYTSSKLNYKRNTPHARDLKVADYLKQITGKEHIVGGCSNCIYNLYYELGRFYFSYKEEQINEEDNSDDKERTVQGISGTTQERTTSRKRSKKTKGKRGSKSV